VVHFKNLRSDTEPSLREGEKEEERKKKERGGHTPLAVQVAD